MVAATISLPTLLKGLEAPSNVRHRREDRARIASAEAAILAIEAARRDASSAERYDDRHASASSRLVTRYRDRIKLLSSDDDAWVTRDIDADIEHEVSLVGLRAERNEIEKIWRHHGIPESRARAIVRELDLQEARHLGRDRTTR